MNNFVLGISILIALQIMIPFTKRHQSSSDVTYTKDAKPIFQKHCSNCHNSNWADRNWMDYETAFKYKDKIKFRTENQTMPPGNPTNMTKAERQVIVDWVNGGGKK